MQKKCNDFFKGVGEINIHIKHRDFSFKRGRKTKNSATLFCVKTTFSFKQINPKMISNQKQKKNLAIGMNLGHLIKSKSDCESFSGKIRKRLVQPLNMQRM